MPTRKDGEAFRSGRPFDFEWAQRRHLEQRQRRIVVRRHPAIDKQSVGAGIDVGMRTEAEAPQQGLHGACRPWRVEWLGQGIGQQGFVPADRQQLRIEKMRGRSAGAHQIDQRIILVADIAGAALPIRRARIVRDDPGAAGIHALGDDAKAGDQVGALQHAVADHFLDLMAQAAGVELRLQQRNAPALALEGKRRQLEIEVFHFAVRYPSASAPAMTAPVEVPPTRSK